MSYHSIVFERLLRASSDIPTEANGGNHTSLKEAHDTTMQVNGLAHTGFRVLADDEYSQRCVLVPSIILYV
jgi:hypothetical protein